MNKKFGVLLISVLLVVVTAGCGGLWFGNLDGMSFEGEYDTYLGDTHWTQVNFETKTTGTMSYKYFFNHIGIGQELRDDETWSFTYEYSFDDDTGTISRPGERTINFETRNSPPNLEIVLQNWPSNGNNSVLTTVDDADENDEE